jgi:hypothetical protein
MNKAEIKEWIRYNKSKTAALIVASLYFVGAICTGELKMLVAVIFFLALCLACIFFGDIMGGVMWPGRGGGVPAINNFIPGPIMVFIGWVLLLYPLWGPAFVWLIEKSL